MENIYELDGIRTNDQTTYNHTHSNSHTWMAICLSVCHHDRLNLRTHACLHSERHKEHNTHIYKTYKWEKDRQKEEKKWKVLLASYSSQSACLTFKIIIDLEVIQNACCLKSSRESIHCERHLIYLIIITYLNRASKHLLHDHLSSTIEQSSKLLTLYAYKCIYCFHFFSGRMEGRMDNTRCRCLHSSSWSL